MNSIKKILSDLKRWEKAVLIFTIVFTLFFFFAFTFLANYENNEWIIVFVATIATFFGIAGDIFVSKRSIHNYIIGGIHVALYGLLAFYVGYYSSFALNIIFFLPMQFVGFYFWRRNIGNDKKYQNVKTFKKENLYIFLIFTIIFYIIFSLIFYYKTDDPAPFVDSAITWLSILAMFLMVYGLWEQWIIWLITNVLTIIMWAFAFADSISTQDTSFYFSFELIYMWIVYLAISIIGLKNWRKKYKNEKVFESLKNKNMINYAQISLNENFNVKNYKYSYSKYFLKNNFEINNKDINNLDFLKF